MVQGYRILRKQNESVWNGPLHEEFRWVGHGLTLLVHCVDVWMVVCRTNELL